MGEWLNQHTANVPKPQGCVGSIPTTSAIMEGYPAWDAGLVLKTSGAKARSSILPTLRQTKGNLK